jgi:hypothetical protein
MTSSLGSPSLMLMLDTCGMITAHWRPTDPRSATAPQLGPRWYMKRSSSGRLCKYMFVSATIKMDAVPVGMHVCNACLHAATHPCTQS